MPLLEGLIKGFAGAAGADDVVARIDKKQGERKALDKEELGGKTQMILEDVGNLQKRRSALPSGSPELAEIDKALTAHQQALTDLYHPTKNPGALQHAVGFIKHHLSKQPVPAAPPSNAVTPERMAGLQASAAGTQAPDPYLTPDELKKSARIAAGLDPKAVPEKPEAENWKTETLKLSDGREISVQHNTKDGTWLDLNHKPIPPELLSAATVSSKSGAGAGKQTSDERARADFNEFKKTHPKYQGTFERWRKEQSTLPKAPGAPKPQRLSSAQNKAQSEYVEAVKLSNIADQVVANPNDAINQKRLAVALERASAGRFTTQALDYIIKAGWGNTLEQWANNPSTGALPKDVLRQLVDGAHQNAKAAKYAMDTAMDLTATIPTSPGEAKKRIKPPSAPVNDDDEFLKKF